MTTLAKVVDRNLVKQLVEGSTHISLSDTELQRLDSCLKISDVVYAGIINDKLACIWGLIPPSLLSTKAYLWLLSTPLVAEHKFLFVRRSQLWIEEVLKTYDEIVGYCDEYNGAAIKWVRWLGGEFGSPSNGQAWFSIRKKHG